MPSDKRTALIVLATFLVAFAVTVESTGFSNGAYGFPGGMPGWWSCINSTSPYCPGYINPRGRIHTVESDLLPALVGYTVAGQVGSIYPLLSDDVSLSFPEMGFAVTGKKNVSIYLSSVGPDYYHVDASIAYAVDTVQEGSAVAVVINQTIPNIFASGLNQRMDLWIVEVDDFHRVASIAILLDTWMAGASISHTPTINESNVVACGLPDESAPFFPCIGSLGPCFEEGYGLPCPGVPVAASVQKSSAFALSQNVTVLRNYTLILHLLAMNAYQALPALGVSFDGVEAVLSYQYAGDPAATDPTYLVINVTCPFIVERQGLVVARFDFWFLALQTGVYFQLRTFQYLVYNDERAVYAYIQQPDTLAIVEHLSATLDLNRTALCDEIAQYCGGAYLQFATDGACESFMATVPLHSATGVSTAQGFSIQCRKFHANLAHLFPQIHCEHAGPLDIDATATPCNNY